MFEDYLKEVFFETYSGAKDNAPDAFEYWLENLDKNDLIDLGNRFGEQAKHKLVQLARQSLSDLEI